MNMVVHDLECQYLDSGRIQCTASHQHHGKDKIPRGYENVAGVSTRSAEMPKLASGVERCLAAVFFFIEAKHSLMQMVNHG